MFSLHCVSLISLYRTNLRKHEGDKFVRNQITLADMSTCLLILFGQFWENGGLIVIHFIDR